MSIFLPSRGLLNGILRYYVKHGRRSEIKLYGETLNGWGIDKLIDGILGSQYGSYESNTFDQSFYLSVNKRQILLYGYTLYSQTGANCYPKSWDFYVSNDNETWNLTHFERNNNILEPKEPKFFSLEYPIAAKYMKWTNKGVSNCKNLPSMYLNEIEIFGRFSPFQGQASCLKKRGIMKMLFTIQFFYVC